MGRKTEFQGQIKAIKKATPKSPMQSIKAAKGTQSAGG